IAEETPKAPPSPAELTYAQRLESEKTEDGLEKPKAAAAPGPASGKSGGPAPAPGQSAPPAEKPPVRTAQAAPPPVVPKTTVPAPDAPASKATEAHPAATP